MCPDRPSVRGQVPTTAAVAQDGSKHRNIQRAASLLNLVNEKREHHQDHQNSRQTLFPMTVVVLKVVALVLECVKGLILNTPSTAASEGECLNGFCRDALVSHPAKHRLDIAITCQVGLADVIDQQIRVALVEW